MRHKHLLPLLLALAMLLPLPACRQDPSPQTVLDTMSATQPPLPAGQCYLDTASPGEKTYAEAELIAALYGNGATPPEWDSVLAFAIRPSSFATPCELAVFRCVSAREAEDVARMCLRRVEILRRTCRDTPYESIAAQATVSIRGSYVLMAVCPDPTAAISAGRQACR